MRSARALLMALLACGLLLLTTTQPWMTALTEVAPGVPRTRSESSGAELVPWLAPLALAAGAALLASAARLRRVRLLTVLTTLGVLGGTVWAALVVIPARLEQPEVVSGQTTAWVTTALVAAALTGVLGVVGVIRPRPDRAPRREGGDEVPDPGGVEAARRQADDAWRQLSAGQDPTES